MQGNLNPIFQVALSSNLFLLCAISKDSNNAKVYLVLYDLIDNRPWHQVKMCLKRWKEDLHGTPLYQGIYLEKNTFRWDFFRKIYTILSLQLILTIAIGSFVIFICPMAIFLSHQQLDLQSILFS